MSSLKTLSEGHLERPTRNIELEGCLKRLNWKATLKGRIKVVSKGRHLLRLSLRAIWKGLPEILNWKAVSKG